LSTNILLTDLFFASRDILSLSPIGEITLPDRIVRRKGEDESAFRPSRSGDSVFVGDTIITGKESSTRINFSDGSTLELGPESMVKIEPIRSYSFSGIRKKLRVTVQAGSVKASTSSASTPMVFESLAGKKLKELEPPKPVELVKIAPKELEVITAPAPLVLAPAPTQASSTPASVLPVKTSVSEAPAAPSRLPPLTPELIRKPETPRMLAEFLSNLKPEPVEANAPVAKEPMIEEKPLLSNYVAPLQAIPDIEVTPLPATPIISDQADLTEQMFQFKWKDAGYRVQLPYSLKIQFKDKLLEFKTPETEYKWNLPLEAEGKISWWVEATFRDGETIQSKKQESSWKLPTPILASPGNHLELPEFYVKGESHEVLLTWKQMQICKGFELNVSTTDDFKEVIFKTRTRKNFQTFPVAKPGTYFWRVACEYTPEYKAFSSPFSFKLSRLK